MSSCSPFELSIALCLTLIAAVGCGPNVQLDADAVSASGTGGGTTTDGSGAGGGAQQGAGTCGSEKGRVFGGQGDQGLVDAASDGSNLIVGGAFDPKIDLNGRTHESAGDVDGIFAKIDAAGNTVWSRRFGNRAEQYAFGVALDPGGAVLVTGQGPFDGELNTASTDVFAAKLGAGGETQWVTRLPHLRANVAADAQSNVLISGSILDEAFVLGDLSIPTNGMYVAKLDPNGAPLWARGAGSERGWSDAQVVAADSSSNVFVAGEFGGTIDLGTGPIHGKDSSIPFSDNIFVAKYDPDGTLLWVKAFAADEFHGNLGALAVDARGNWLLAAAAWGVVDFGGGDVPSTNDDDQVYVAAFDSAAEHLWTRRFGRGIPLDIQFDARGGVVVVGIAEGEFDTGVGPMQVAGGSDAFFARLGPGGEPICGRLFGDDADQTASSVRLRSDGSAWVVGYFKGEMALLDDTLKSLGDDDAFVLEIGR